MKFKRNDEVATYKRELVKALAAASLAGPNIVKIEDDSFAEKLAIGVVYIADAIITELEKE